MKISFQSNNRSSGYLAIAIILFSIMTAVLAHSALPGAEVQLKNRKETALKYYLAEYNMAVLRFQAVNGRVPKSIEELAAFKGGLRRIYSDPFTGRKDFAMVKNLKGGVFIVSSSADKSLDGVSYSALTSDISRRFVKYESAGFDEICGYKIR
ncbi:MAG TPA: hypothetical protein PKK26_12485 [Candidatus Wallbacteria bacterium]|nr:hypothetical protein [Candidatus Wallbacteria bacterium]